MTNRYTVRNLLFRGGEYGRSPARLRLQLVPRATAGKRVQHQVTLGHALHLSRVPRIPRLKPLQPVL